MNHRFTRILAVAGLMATVLAGGAQATGLFANLDGLSETPPNNSPATGFATLLLNDQTLVLSYQLDYSLLQGPTTASHIHRGGAGVPGPVVYPLALGNFPSGATGTVQINAADLPDLLNQGMYVNIHTQIFPGGEIRGQVRVSATSVEPGTWGSIKNLFR
jgi:hypothetical protein